MKLTKKQVKQLKEHKYEPCVRNLSLYPEDFRGGVWQEIISNLDCDIETTELTLAIVGINTD